MSPFVRGLLGGVAEGVTETAGMLFADAISQKKEERLAKIADRNYARDRADQLADIESQRGFQMKLANQDRTFEQQLADAKLDAFTAFRVDDTGVVYGVNARGESQAISGFKEELISFGDLTRLKTSATQELALYPDDDRAAELKTFVTSLDNAIKAKLEVGGYGADGPTPEQITADGRLLFGDDGIGPDSVEIDGVTYSGATLEQLRKFYRDDYGDYYDRMYQR